MTVGSHTAQPRHVQTTEPNRLTHVKCECGLAALSMKPAADAAAAKRAEYQSIMSRSYFDVEAVTLAGCSQQFGQRILYSFV